LTLGGLALADGTGLASNYTFIGGTHTGQVTQATITALSLQGTVTKQYDGDQTVSNLASGNYLFAGLLGGETFTVSEVNGDYTTASENVVDNPAGSGVTSDVLTVAADIADGSALKSNYDLTAIDGTQASGNIGEITQAPLATYTGAANGSWSTAGNWDIGGVPSLGNVASVNLGGVNVVFTDLGVSPAGVNAGLTRNPTLANLNTGSLTINSGRLTVNTATNVTNYTQTNGILSGAGTFTAATGYNQTGGSIDVTGNVAINGAANTLGNIATNGNLSVPGANTLGANATLTAATHTLTNVTGAGFNLTLNFADATTINGANFTGINILNVGTGGATTLTGTITTTDNQIYNNAVTLAGTTTLNTGGSAQIRNGLTGGGFNLSVNGNAGFAGMLTNVPSLSISGATLITDNTTFNTDLLTLGAVTKASNPGVTLTINPITARPDGSTYEIGGTTDALFRTANVNSLSAAGGFGGVLNLIADPGDATTLPGFDNTSATLAPDYDVNVTASLNAGASGKINIVARGDIVLTNGASPALNAGVVSLTALGGASNPESGNILDTDPSAAANPSISARALIAIANNRVGSDDNALGGAINATITDGISVIQGSTEDALINSNAGAVDTATTFANLTNNLDLSANDIAANFGSDTGGAITVPGVFAFNFFSSTELTASTISSAGLESAGLETKSGEDAGVDEGVFLLPDTFSVPELALLMPILQDPDYPADTQPEDPDDDEAWAEFFGTLKEFVESRYQKEGTDTGKQKLSRNARKHIKEDLGIIKKYYKWLRKHMRKDLAAVDNPETPTLSLGYNGQSWAEGGIGVEPHRWWQQAGAWPGQYSLG